MSPTYIIHSALLAAVIVVSGCRQEGSVGARAQNEAPDKSVAGGGGEPDRSRPLSADQQQAVEKILAAGGSIEYDMRGYPVLIDLASDRVFAVEEVVLACLKFPRLERLRLAVTAVDPEAITRLASLTQLTELMLQDATVTNSDLAHIVNSTPRLRRLTLRRLSRITDVAIDALVKCPRLEVIALIEMSQLTGDALDKLRRVDGLRSLDLRNSGLLAGDDFRKLAALPQLTELKIGGPAIADEVLAIIARHPTIRSISIEDAEVSETCLQRFAEVPAFAKRLQSLAFARCFGVTDDSLATLNRFPNLKTLALRDIMLTGDFFGQLADTSEAPPPLGTLVITNAFVSDETIAVLPTVFPELTRLDVRGNSGITDASRSVFKQLKALKNLQLAETGVTSMTQQ